MLGIQAKKQYSPLKTLDTSREINDRNKGIQDLEIHILDAALL